LYCKLAYTSPRVLSIDRTRKQYAAGAPERLRRLRFGVTTSSSLGLLRVRTACTVLLKNFPRLTVWALIMIAGRSHVHDFTAPVQQQPSYIAVGGGCVTLLMDVAWLLGRPKYISCLAGIVTKCQEITHVPSSCASPNRAACGVAIPIRGARAHGLCVIVLDFWWQCLWHLISFRLVCAWDSRWDHVRVEGPAGCFFPVSGPLSVIMIWAYSFCLEYLSAGLCM
jgi:hypothetical protein